MKITLETQIDRSAPAVWRVLAEEFTEIHQWLDGVVDSYAIPGETDTDTDHCSGRVCQLSDKPDGLQAWETITHYDADNYELEIDVEVRNAPPALPLKRNHAAFRLEVLSPTQTRVSLEAGPELAAHGYLLYPLLKLGISKQLQSLLDSLKSTVEGRPELVGVGTQISQSVREQRMAAGA